jgi:UV DNA damage endonuclease
MFPLFDKVDRSLYDNSAVKSKLKAIGEFVLKHSMRVNTHPGQYVVLSSDRPEVVNNAVTELNFHGWVFDAMQLDRSPYYGINVHGGKSDRIEALKAGIALLDASARDRLTLENDEFSYTVKDLATVNVPVVYDSHHHTLNPGGLSHDEALALAISTWKGVKPTTHLSNSCPGTEHLSVSKRRVHSDYITYIPAPQKDLLIRGQIDVEVEAKAKNNAIDLLLKLL